MKKYNRRGEEGKGIDETFSAMFSNPKFQKNYTFYGHILGQCTIEIDEKIPAPAGVYFYNGVYKLIINPKSKWVPLNSVNIKNIDEDEIKTINGTKMYRIVKGFNDYTLEERLAILKHEALHILLNHIHKNRKGDKEIVAWNYATDCALNQMINKNHLPKGAILPEILSTVYNVQAEENRESEYYYDLIKEESCPNCGKPNKDPNSTNSTNPTGSTNSTNSTGSKNYNPMEKNNLCQDCQNNSSGKNSGNGTKENEKIKGIKSFDSHDIWEKSEGDEELQKTATKRMIEKAQRETIKSGGHLPAECSEWIKINSVKTEIDWKKILRNIVGNKKVGYRTTIYRKNRRFQDRDDLHGRIKKRSFNLLVIADVSGSMSNESINRALGEVRHICKMTKTSVDLIQIDTCAKEPEKLTKNVKVFQRKGSGGTELSGALERAKEYNIDFQAIVVLTDGYLFEHDLEEFKKLKKRVIWLITPDGMIMSSMNEGRMRAFKLKE